MRFARRILRGFAGALAGLAIMTTWPLSHADSQATDLIAQARQALDAGRPDDAMAYLEKAVTADPKNPSALAWLGSAQVQKARAVPIFDRPGWVKKGFNTLDEAVERFPDASVVYVMRGITAAQVPDMFKKAPLAVTDLGTVLAMREKNSQLVPDSDMPAVYLHLGIAYKKNGQIAEARATWEKGKNAYPSAPQASAMEKELRGL